MWCGDLYYAYCDLVQPLAPRFRKRNQLTEWRSYFERRVRADPDSLTTDHVEVRACLTSKLSPIAHQIGDSSEELSPNRLQTLSGRELVGATHGETGLHQKNNRAANSQTTSLAAFCIRRKSYLWATSESNSEKQNCQTPYFEAI
jgi:hypothetical protein